MPRLARLVHGGVPYHVTQRGNRRGSVFFGDADRMTYLTLLREYSVRHSIAVLAYCLMTNHVHLVLVPDEGPALHRALKPLHMRHAQRINRMHGWKGHLWQGRYFSSALDDTYLLAAIRYVERNPVRAGLVDRSEQYRWSSAAAHCGLSADPALSAGETWQRRHVNQGLPCGAPAFLEQLERASGRRFPARSPGRPRTAGKKG